MSLSYPSSEDELLMYDFLNRHPPWAESWKEAGVMQSNRSVISGVTEKLAGTGRERNPRSIFEEWSQFSISAIASLEDMHINHRYFCLNLFNPSSYRRAVKYGQKDAANEILRTEVLGRLQKRRSAMCGDLSRSVGGESGITRNYDGQDVKTWCG